MMTLVLAFTNDSNSEHSLAIFTLGILGGNILLSTSIMIWHSIFLENDISKESYKKLFNIIGTYLYVMFAVGLFFCFVTLMVYQSSVGGLIFGIIAFSVGFVLFLISNFLMFLKNK